MADTIHDRIEQIKQKEFITVAECALLLGVSERTIWRRLLHLGPLVREGRITRINRRSALRHFLAKGDAERS